MKGINGTLEPGSLKQMIQDIIPEAMGILRGRVTRADPLEITVTGDEKLVLTENIICLPGHLKEHEVKADIELQGVFEKDAVITVKNSLKNNEAVYLLSFNHGKKYYVLGRQ